MNSKGMIGRLIGYFVVILIGVSLIKPIMDTTEKFSNQNQDSLSSSLASFSGSLIGALILGMGIIFILKSFQSINSCFGGEYEKDEKGFFTRIKESINEIMSTIGIKLVWRKKK